MGRISQKQREMHVDALKEFLPLQWKSYAKEIEDVAYKYFFLSDCREAYEFKLQSLVHDLAEFINISPKEVNIIKLVKTPSQDMETLVSATIIHKMQQPVKNAHIVMPFEAIGSARAQAQTIPVAEPENKNIKEKIDKLKAGLVEVMGEEKNFFTCGYGCPIELPGQIAVLSEVQSSRADEPMTVTLFCKRCKNSWKKK